MTNCKNSIISKKKRISFLFAFLNIGLFANAQNVFPPNGNVGIGTNTPLAPLHIISGNSYNTFKFNNGAANLTPNISVGVSIGKSLSLVAGTSGTGVTFDETGPFAIYKDNKTNIDGGSSNGGTALMTVSGNGNVAVNSINQGSKFHVNGSATFTSTTALGTETAGGINSFGLLYTDRSNVWTEVAVHNQGSGVMLYANPQNSQYSGLWGTTYSPLSAGLITNPYYPLVLGAGTESMRINTNGNVGIGTANANRKLHITGDNAMIRIADTKYDAGTLGIEFWHRVPNDGIPPKTAIISSGTLGYGVSDLRFVVNGTFDFNGYDINNDTRLIVKSNGNVGIGTTNPGTMKLAVAGTIGARKVVVTQTNPFPDYVFKPDYKLRSLTEEEAYIEKYSHLPEVPSANDVEKDGLDLGSTQAVLLKKIEELTLYVIEQNKQQESEKTTVEKLNSKLQKQEKLIEGQVKLLEAQSQLLLELKAQIKK